MKNKIKFLIVTIFISLFVLSSCEKSDIIKLNSPTGGNLIISGSNKITGVGIVSTYSITNSSSIITYKWTISDNTVVKLSGETGKSISLTALKKGTATLNVSGSDGASSSITIEVAGLTSSTQVGLYKETSSTKFKKNAEVKLVLFTSVPTKADEFTSSLIQKGGTYNNAISSFKRLATASDTSNFTKDFLSANRTRIIAALSTTPFSIYLSTITAGDGDGTVSVSFDTLLIHDSYKSTDLSIIPKKEYTDFITVDNTIPKATSSFATNMFFPSFSSYYFSLGRYKSYSYPLISNSNSNSTSTNYSIRYVFGDSAQINYDDEIYFTIGFTEEVSLTDNDSVLLVSGDSKLTSKFVKSDTDPTVYIATIKIPKKVEIPNAIYYDVTYVIDSMRDLAGNWGFVANQDGSKGTVNTFINNSVKRLKLPNSISLDITNKANILISSSDRSTITLDFKNASQNAFSSRDYIVHWLLTAGTSSSLKNVTKSSFSKSSVINSVLGDKQLLDYGSKEAKSVVNSRPIDNILKSINLSTKDAIQVWIYKEDPFGNVSKIDSLGVFNLGY